MDEGGAIIKTTDGGKSWTSISNTTTSWLYSVTFTDPVNGYAVGQNGTIIKTTDAGLSWTPITVDTLDNFVSVRFIDKNTGYAVGGRSTNDVGVILKTVNAGATWISIYTRTRVVTSICFLNSTVGYATSYDAALNGTILKTIDGGTTWKTDAADLKGGYLSSLYFTCANNGYAVGSGGVMYKYGK